MAPKDLKPAIAGQWWLPALGFVLFFFLSTATFSLLGNRAVSRAGPQPIEFNHRLHTQDLEIECIDCHEFYEAETFSGLPTAETCAFCHEEVAGESQEEARLVKIIQEGAPLVWQPLYRQPSHVFYSHRRHVVVGGMECEGCHAAIAASERPPRKVRTLTMDNCLDCHLEAGAGTDCTNCHR